MVTLAGTQNFNEFELYLRAIFYHIWNYFRKAGASAVIAASENNESNFHWLEKLPVSQKPISEFWQPTKTMKNGSCTGQWHLETPIEEICRKSQSSQALKSKSVIMRKTF
jgi:phosphoribosylglycinamide formyltransferase 2